MLETQAVESDAPHLDLQQGILKKPLIQLLEDVFLDKKFFDHLLLKLRIRMLLLHLLRGEFGDLERSLQSCNRHCKRVKVHELALMADVASGMRRDLLAVLLGAVHVLLSLALGTFDEDLQLLLIRPLVVRRVVPITETVDVRFPTQRGVIQHAGRGRGI